MNKRIGILLFLFLIFTVVSVNAEENSTNWDEFSINLVKALKSGNQGLQQSAMQHIITNSNNLDISKEGIFEIIRVFKFVDDINMRRMAMIALHKTGDSYAMYFLLRNYPLESDKEIKKQCAQILNEYFVQKKGNGKVRLLLTAAVKK